MDFSRKDDDQTFSKQKEQFLTNIAVTNLMAMAASCPQKSIFRFETVLPSFDMKQGVCGRKTFVQKHSDRLIKGQIRLKRMFGLWSKETML